ITLRGVWNLMYDNTLDVGTGPWPGQLNTQTVESGIYDLKGVANIETIVWTPVAVGRSSAGVGTYVVQRGIATRVGNIVNAAYHIEYSAHTGTGILVIRGIPFMPITTDVNSYINLMHFSGNVLYDTT